MPPADLRVVRDDSRALGLIEQFRGLALRHVLALSLEHRQCPEPERALCAVCAHAQRVNAIATEEVRDG